MANYLVTGSRGEPHVTSAQVGAYDAASFGGGRYVLTGMEASLSGPNSVHVSEGVALFNGRFVVIPSGGADAVVENGSQGMARSDLVALRYESDSGSGVESVDLVVIKGEPSASSPEDPAYNGGSILDGSSPCDMPLYRVTLSGAAVGEPEMVADGWSTLKEIEGAVLEIQETGGAAVSGRLASLESDVASLEASVTPEPVVLFNSWDNPNPGAAALSQSALGFDKIEIYCKSVDSDTAMTPIYDPAPNSRASLTISNLTNVTGQIHLYVKSRTVCVTDDGMAIETVRDPHGSGFLTGQVDIMYGGVAGVTNGDDLSIYAVLGYRWRAHDEEK